MKKAQNGVSSLTLKLYPGKYQVSSFNQTQYLHLILYMFMSHKPNLKVATFSSQIKFIVDGQWKVDPLRPIVTCDGYENNLLIIS